MTTLQRTHSIKLTITLFLVLPIVTVILARVLFKERQSTRVYISLIPIITGVAIATLTELSFDVIGLIAALIATCGFSLQNLYSKKVMKETGVHSFELLATLGRLSLCMFTPFWILIDVRSLFGHYPVETDWWNVSLLLATDGLLNFCQNILAFAVLSIVTPLTYAVANASKRIVIISVSLILLRNPVTVLNVIGMVIAVCGVFLYTRAKHVDSSSKSILPIAYTNSDGNLNYLKTIV